MLKHKTAMTMAAAAGLLLATGTIAAGQDQPVSQGGFAVVTPAGGMPASLNVKSIEHPSAGVYQLRFNQPVWNCAATATAAGKADSSPMPAYIVITKIGHVTLQINTYSTTELTPTDTRFDVALTC